jgi:hypothetical protein
MHAMFPDSCLCLPSSSSALSCACSKAVCFYFSFVEYQRRQAEGCAENAPEVECRGSAFRGGRLRWLMVFLWFPIAVSALRQVCLHFDFFLKLLWLFFDCQLPSIHYASLFNQPNSNLEIQPSPYPYPAHVPTNSSHYAA